MNEKLKDYKERHIRWQNSTINQFGYTNNIIITIGIAFLAFAFDKDFLSTFSISKESVFNLKMLIHVIIIICLLISIGCGIMTTLSRLYDFRLTRHIALTRQRFYDKKTDVLPDYSFPKTKCKKLISTSCKIIFGNIELLTKKQTLQLKEDVDLMNKFNMQRNLANTLGELSWKYMKWQLHFLFISIFAYSINLFV